MAVAGADFLWEKSTADWLVAGAGTDLVCEKITAIGNEQNRVNDL